jgi:hypothetical protein
MASYFAKLLFLLIFINNGSADVVLEQDQEIANAIKAYELFLEGKSEKEIKKEIQIPESIDNVHEALDYVVYLTKVSKIKRTIGLEKFDSCRADLNSESEFNLFLKTYKGISSSIRREYLTEWSYDFPERVSCNICLGNENCKSAHQKWKDSNLINNSNYSSLKNKKQKELCLEMAQYAFKQASTGLVEEGGERSNCPGGSVCLNSNPYWSVIYGYDFKICQEDFLICPRLKDSKKFLHPSCYGDEEIEKINDKMNWLNSQAEDILYQCNGIPLDLKKLDRPILISCLNGMDNQDQPGLINMNPQNLSNLQIVAPIYKYTTSKGDTYSFQATRFQEQKNNLDKKLLEIRLKLEENNAKLLEHSTKEYNWNTKSYNESQKNGSTISPDEFQQLRTQISDLESELAKTSKERKEIISQEIKKIPQGIKSGDYVKYLEHMRDYSETNSERYHYYEDGVITSSEIIQDGATSDFPLNGTDQQTLAMFVKEKIKNIIITNGNKKGRSLRSVEMLSNAWTKDCMDQKLKRLGCEPSTYLPSPYCTNCPTKLTQSQMDVENENKQMTKNAYRRNFYQQRNCSDYKEDYSQLSSQLMNEEIKNHVCSKSLSVGNRDFLKKRPSVCSGR